MCYNTNIKAEMS